MRKILFLLALLVTLSLSACASSVELGNLFTPTFTLTPSVTPTVTETPASTETFTPSPTETLTPTLSPTVTPSPTATPTDTITPGPSPTDTRTPTITRTPTRTRIPTRTRVPSRTPTITLTPTITNTPTPPPPQTAILRPGLLSRVVSPIQAEINVIPGEDGMVRIELIGEDGRIIVRQVLDYRNYRGRSITIYPQIPFEIQAMAETARLQVITQDRFGRIITLMSVDVVLLSLGRAEIYPPLVTQEPYIVRFPLEGQVVSGGVLWISGLARPVNSSPILIELVDENGAVLTTKLLTVEPPVGELSHTPFEVEIPYRVTTSTPVRLTFRQEGGRIPGTVALSSRVIVLEP